MNMCVCKVSLSFGVALGLHVQFVASDAAAAPAQTARATYVVGGEVHVGDGTVIRDGIVAISGDSIRRVGPKTLDIPADAEIINVSGLVVTPGLIAAGVPLGLSEIAAEESTVDQVYDRPDPIRASFDPSAAIYAESTLIPVQTLAGVTSALVSPSGGVISGQVAWIDLMYGAHRELVRYRGVAIAGALGQSFGASRAASLDLLRRAFEDARFYRTNQAAYDRGQSRPLVAHPRDLAALQPLLQGRIPLSIAADRASDLLALVDLVRDYRLSAIAIGASEGWKVAEELAAAKISVLVQPTANLPNSFSEIGARIDNAAILAKAGVNVMIAEIGSAHNARNLRQEAGIAVAYGLAWEEALSAITRNVAQAYGHEREYGTLAANKVANLVVWTGDPLELSSAPKHVFVRGRAIPLVSRQTLLRDRYLDLSGYVP